MSISRARRSAQACAAVAAGLMAIPLAELPAHAAATPATSASGTAAPSAAHHRPLRGPQLSIGLGDGRTIAKVGDRLAYAVSVRNAGASQAPHLAVTLTLPSGVRFISAVRNGAARAGKITWHADIAAGRSESFLATGRVTRTSAGTPRLAAVACAAERGGSKPIVCAADLDQTAATAGTAARTAARAAGPGLGYAAAAGGVVLAGGALAILILGRRSRASRRMRHSG
jgi:uncharacterized repeat protein (TIGR01451 family)